MLNNHQLKLWPGGLNSGLEIRNSNLISVLSPVLLCHASHYSPIRQVWSHSQEDAVMRKCTWSASRRVNPTPALSIADCVAGQWSVTPSGPDWSHALSCSGWLYKTWQTPADSKSPQENNKVTAGARHPDVRVWSATNLQSGPEPLSFSVSYKPGEMHCHRCGTTEKMKVLWELHNKIP